MKNNCELCGHPTEQHYMHKTGQLVTCKPCSVLASNLDITNFPCATLVQLPGLPHLIVVAQDGDEYSCTTYPNRIDYANHRDRGVKTYHTSYGDAFRYGVFGLLADYYTLRN